MLQGIVCDFDARDGVGIIESDGGLVVLFNTDNLEYEEDTPLRPGTRVKFVAHESKVGFHADAIYLAD
jgi:cold shock CspA family protein